MAFFDFLNKKEAVIPPALPEAYKFGSFQVELSKPEVPVIKESSKGAWVEYGERNDYPEVLLSFLETSSLHNGITQGKSYLISGGRILIDGRVYEDWRVDAPVNDITKMDLFLNNFGDPLFDIKSNAALDYTISGSFALEIVWSLDFSRIAKINYVPWNRLRPEARDAEGNINHYYYSEDWSQFGGFFRKGMVEPLPLQTFDPAAHRPEGGKLPEDWKYQHNQILFTKNHWPGYDYFGRPVYQGALTDISADSKLSLFYLGAVENGFTPSVLITYTEPVGSEEEARTIGKNIQKEFTIKGAGRKIMVLFANSPETAPKVEPLNVQNLDQQMIALQAQLQNAIVTGHGVTSPELVGVSVPGQLGTGDLQLKWNIFYNNIIKKDRLVIERVFNQLAKINGIENLITFETINPLA